MVLTPEVNAITEFQSIAKSKPPPAIFAGEPTIEKPQWAAQQDAAMARRIAYRRGVNPLDQGEDLDGRLTAIKHSIHRGEIDNAVEVLVDSLIERTEKLKGLNPTERRRYGADDELIRLLEDFGIYDLTLKSPILELFLHYRDLLRQSV